MSSNQKPQLKNRAKQLFVYVLIVVVAFSVAYVIDYFYQKQHGEPLTIPVPSILATPTPEEKEITPEEIQEYTVAPDKPRYFNLPILGIHKARILQVGKDPKTNEIGTPAGIYDIGWFNQSALPGGGQTIILDGHNGGPTKDGIFKYLHNATRGNDLTIERGDGQIFTYEIIENYNIKVDDFTQEEFDKMVGRINNSETVSIITCSGKWLNDRQTYDQRTIVKAVLK